MAKKAAPKKTPAKRHAGASAARKTAKAAARGAKQAPTILAVAVGPRREIPRVKQPDLAGRHALRPIIKGLVSGLKKDWKKDLDKEYRIFFWQAPPDVLLNETAQVVSRANPQLIFTIATSALRAARNAANNRPIVFTIISDPLTDAGIQSISHPGGHVTGVRSGLAEAAPECLRKFKTMVPRLANVHALYRPGFTPAERAIPLIQQALPPGVKFHPTPFQSLQELDRFLDNPDWPGTSDPGLLVIPDDLLVSHSEKVVHSTHQKRVPVFFPVIDPVNPRSEPPGHSCPLGAYGVPGQTTGEAAAEYVNKVLFEGDDPGELRIKEAGPFQWWVNRAVARDLGIDLSPILKDVDAVFN